LLIADFRKINRKCTTTLYVYQQWLLGFSGESITLTDSMILAMNDG